MKLRARRVFFFKQKTAYEISACLVGSEMCIRDRSHGGCSAYLARLRDAFFMVNADDLAAAEADLRHKGMSQEDVDGKKVRDLSLIHI